MALILKDRVLESSTSTGTGSFTLTGAQTGYQSFSAIGNGNTTYYTIQGKNPDGTLTGEWEVGIGTWSTGNTLARDTVLSNSLGTTAKIAFSAGAKDVFCDYPASKSVNQNADNKVLIPYTPGVTNVGSLNVGDATGHSDSGVIAAFTASEPLYLYTSLQNTSSANTSYASYAVNDGGHTSYGELGINNSNYSYTAAGFPNNTFSAPLATFVESYGGPLAIGTWDSQKISFIVNGSVNTADAMTISAAGVVSLGTALGVTSGGTGTTTSTGTGSNVLSDAPSLTGAVIIGGTTDTATLTLGRSTAAQTVNIATGTTAAATTKAINIGNAGNATSTTNIAIGSATGTSTTTHNGINKYPTLTASQAVFTNASKNLVSVASTGTGSVVLNDSPTFTSKIVVNDIKIGRNSAVDSSIVGNTLAIPNNSISSTTVVGYQALESDSSNGGNTVVGAYAFRQNTAGIDNNDGNNTIIGSNCLQNSLYSDFTTAIGANITVNPSSLAQSGCVYVGQGISANGNANEIVIGNNQVGRGDNTTLIGNSQSVTYLSLVIIGEGFTVATLPSTSATGQVIGARCFVTNALAPVFGSNVVGGGTVKVPVYYDGTNWKVG